MEALIVIASLAIFGVYLVAIGVFRESDRLAVASFVFSILWLGGLGSILGLILGLVAVWRIDSSAEKGQGFAVAGIILGALGLIVTAVLIILVVQAIEDGILFGF